MPHFDAGGTARTPFGKNQYLRSTKDVKLESYTFAKDAIPTETIDGETQKVLQPGTVLAKITSGADSGKIGVYVGDDPTEATVTDGRANSANIVGVNDTFLPWQLLERDVEVAAAYEAAVKEAWCFEYTAAGARVAMTTTTRDAIIALDGVALLFK